MSSAPADFNAQVIEEFRANDGRVGGMLADMQLLLLHHKGARSGLERVNPLAYLEDDGRYVIFASKAGHPDHPGWYFNLKAHPNTRIEVGADKFDVVAHEAEADERHRLFSQMAELSPQFAEYDEMTERVIPVMVLTPA
jgi:deazaflavin-dependent oxidoreductase (nitroreductase family)